MKPDLVADDLRGAGKAAVLGEAPPIGEDAARARVTDDVLFQERVASATTLVRSCSMRDWRFAGPGAARPGGGAQAFDFMSIRGAAPAMAP